MRKDEKKFIVYMGFIDLEKAYDRVNRETLWQVLKCMMWVANCLMELRLCMLTGFSMYIIIVKENL